MDIKKNYDQQHAKNLAEKYGLLPNLHWWPHKQSGKFILTHDAVQIIADAEGVTFEEPVKNWDELPNISLLVVGHLKDRKEWSFGECNPKNSFNPYPWAMAEKRAKDRVTLKLIGAYKMGVSSEIEAEGFSERTKVVVDDDDGSGLDSQKKTLEGRKKEKKPSNKEIDEIFDRGDVKTEKLDRDMKNQIVIDAEKSNRSIKEGLNKLDETKTWFSKMGADERFNSVLSAETGGLTDLAEISKNFDVEEILKPLRDSYRQLISES